MQKKRCLNLILTVCLTSLVANAQAPAPKTLKDAFKGAFVVGAAINSDQITGRDALGDSLLLSQFNSISPENVMKWEVIHPRPGVYDFTLADQYVELGLKNHMFIVGHNLCWHSQVPAWVFKDDKGDPITRDALIERLHDHIRTVVGRYKGKIASWDVVNEALNEDGTLRQSPWMKIIGEDYLVKAFQFAHEADPNVQLNYNDYNLETPAKRKGAIALVRKLQAAGVPIAVVGDQAHLHLDEPSAAEEDATITELAACRTTCSKPWRNATRISSPSTGSTATSSTASRSGASPTRNPGSTTGRSADAPRIRCSSTARASPSRRSKLSWRRPKNRAPQSIAVPKRWKPEIFPIASSDPSTSAAVAVSAAPARVRPLPASRECPARRPPVMVASPGPIHYPAHRFRSCLSA